MSLAFLYTLSAHATSDMNCGKKKTGKHKVELHIEMFDQNGEPQDWDFRVNGQKPFSLDPAKIESDNNGWTVTVQTSDSTWLDYKFSDPDGDCAEYDSNTYKGVLQVSQRNVTASKVIKTLKCNCIED